MPGEDDVRTVQVDEVIPPGAPDPMRRPPIGAKAVVRGALPKLLAYYLDEFKTIPGTKLKIGLDPILGFLFPVVGDAVGAAAGSIILAEGLRRGVPKAIVVRMAANVLINATFGSIPLVGDFFSLWFKSNSQNYALLQRHGGDPNHPLVKPKLWPLAVFLLGVFALIGLVVAGVAWLVRWLIH